MKIKIYNGAAPNSKQLRLKTTHWEKINFEFFMTIMKKCDAVRKAGYEIDLTGKCYDHSSKTIRFE